MRAGDIEKVGAAGVGLAVPNTPPPPNSGTTAPGLYPMITELVTTVDDTMRNGETVLCVELSKKLVFRTPEKPFF